jgi:hypothetical protein
MTAISVPAQHNHSGGVFMILVGLVILAMVASAHAVMTHGSAALDAMNCFNGEGMIAPQIYVDPMSGRTMEFCHNNKGWFAKIDGCDGGNITCFPRSFAKSLRDCIEYAKRTGFTFELPIIP